MDRDVDELVRSERLADAAALAAARGESTLAADLYERACMFGAAARAALDAHDAGRALLLGAIANDDVTAERALAGLADEGARARAAHELARRGHHAWAARVLEASGRGAEAASAWARAGRADRAAELLERLGDPIAAARELESALRASSARHDLRLQLGRLLLRHGRTEAAVRVLQAIEGGAAERAPALGELVRAFEALGLSLAAAEAKRELEELGGPASAAGADHASDAPRAPEPRPLLYGRYEVVREIASTASAHVMECVDVLTAEPIALKVFAGSGLHGVGRDALARFEREVAILRTLRHPNVVPLRAYLPEGPALALAWMPGGSLAEMLERDRLAPARAIEIAAALLDALASAHRAGVIHRDVKPSNVLFDGAGVARLSDFGAAHLGDLAATATAGVIGTFAYMSPEQREGRPATVASDVYSVGVVLREMLTGRRPDDEERVEPSAVHRDLGPAHDAVIARLTRPRPEERPQGALDARRMLLELTWPRTHEPIAPRALMTPRPARATLERLEALGDDLAFDRWTGRRVRVVPLTERALARARAFAAAAADGPGVELVLRVDTAKREIWIEDRDGRALDRPLEKDEARTLERALGMLHDAGIAHGHVDREHVRVSDRHRVWLRFEADAAPTATPDLDRIALASLRNAGGEPT